MGAQATKSGIGLIGARVKVSLLMMSPDEKMDLAKMAETDAKKYFNCGKFELALENYHKALRYDRESAVLFSNRAMCYLKLRRYYEAITDCNRALQIDPSMIKAYYRRGLASSELYRYRSALEDFEKVLIETPGDVFVNRHVDKIKSMIESDTRVDLILHNKPIVYRSRTPMITMNDCARKHSGSIIPQAN